MRQAQIEVNLVVNLLVATPEAVSDIPGTWVSVEDDEECGIGWNYLPAGNPRFTQPNVPASYRTLLDLAEWTATWTDDEWENLQGAAYERGYTVDWTGHPLDSQTVPQGTQRKMRKLFDAIKLTNSFDVQSDKADQFYNYLESVNFIDSDRKDELQQGVLE